MTTRVFTADGSELQSANPVLVKIYNTGTQTIAGASTTAIDFNTLEFAVGHSTVVPTYDLTANSITIVQAGYYRVMGTVHINSSGGSADYSAILSRNGSPIAYDDIATNAGYITLRPTRMAYFAKGDVITFSVYHAGASSHPTLATPGRYASLSVEMIK